LFLFSGYFFRGFMDADQRCAPMIYRVGDNATDNLKAVAEALRAKYPDIEIIISADDDYVTEGNPGITKATEAARAVNGEVEGKS